MEKLAIGKSQNEQIKAAFNKMFKEDYYAPADFELVRKPFTESMKDGYGQRESANYAIEISSDFKKRTAETAGETPNRKTVYVCWKNGSVKCG